MCAKAGGRREGLSTDGPEDECLRGNRASTRAGPGHPHFTAAPVDPKQKAQPSRIQTQEGRGCSGVPQFHLISIRRGLDLWRQKSRTPWVRRGRWSSDPVLGTSLAQGSPPPGFLSAHSLPGD